MKKIIFLFLLLNLTSCVVWDLMPSYSSSFDEDIWIHQKTKEALNDDVHNYCLRQSLKEFNMANKYSSSTVKTEMGNVESNRIYASCLRENGFVFNASYKYCYKFPYICQKYNEYRR